MSDANHTISIKFGMYMWISFPRMVSWWTIDILHSRWQSDAILKIGYGRG